MAEPQGKLHLDAQTAKQSVSHVISEQSHRDTGQGSPAVSPALKAITPSSAEQGCKKSDQGECHHETALPERPAHGFEVDAGHSKGTGCCLYDQTESAAVSHGGRPRVAEMPQGNQSQRCPKAISR
uniref:Uncharacterized protein n=1 Tax=Haptolina brevifila TaxID=156173 RepID=A0A7S2FEI1_9EUKA